MNLEQIDTSTTAGKAEVMRLAAEGRRVAYQAYGLGWSQSKWPSWNWSDYDYAIISEPVGPEELFVVMRPNQTAAAVCDTMERAQSWNGLPVVRYLRADLTGEKG